jgi:polyisoprenoid-binding protein YceI
MPLNLDSCITGVFVPGNIGASAGLPPVVRVMPPAEGPALPTITSAATASNLEAAVLAHALTADEAVTWSIVGGADAAMFEVSGSTLRWLGNGVRDFEAPDDANTDNAYEVTVRATDTALFSTDQNITITVTDVLEAAGFGDSAMVTGPIMVNGDGTPRDAYIDGVMVNL